MTEEKIKKKAEEYAKSIFSGNDKDSAYYQQLLFTAYKDGYEQGQKDFDTKVTKLLNSYGVTFIDTNSIGGLIALHQLMLDLEKENKELKERLRIESQSLHEQCEIVCKQVEQFEKMKCCENCNKNRKAKCDDNLRVLARINRICDKWELAE